MNMKVLIVEDEQPAARRLQRLLSEVTPEFQLLGHADGIESAVEFLQQEIKPDIIFMDIQLADGLAFDIFSKIKIDIPIVFTTAYDQYAIRAFKVNSIDYLLKPIVQEELIAAISKWKQLRSTASESNFDYSLLARNIREQKNPFRKRFLIKSAGRFVFVAVEDIAYFFSEEGNSFLVTRSADRFLVDIPLDEIESELDPEDFFRINRKMILAIPSIKRIEPIENGRFILEISPDFEEEITVSRQRSGEFRHWLDR